MLSLVAARPRQLVGVDSLSDPELGVKVAAKDFLSSSSVSERRLIADPRPQNGIVPYTRSN